MNNAERLQHLKDIQTCLKIISKNAVKPSEYHKDNQININGALSVAILPMRLLLEEAASAGAPASGYKPLIVNGNLRELPDITRAASYPFNIAISMHGEKYLILLADFSELAEAVNVLHPMIEAGAASLIGINQLFTQPGASPGAPAQCRECSNTGVYTCLTCSASLCYGHTIIFDGLEYCAACAPGYDKQAQW